MLVPLEFLWLPALCVAIFGAWVLVRVMKTGRVLALSLASLKVVIPLLYFAFFYRSGWTLLDDLSYFEKAHLLLLKGNNPFLILFTQDGRERLFAIAGGRHILYYWWNLLAVYLFHPFYSSPVFLNVGTTFISAALLFRIARLSGVSESYAKWLGIFFLVQWDVVAWSSFVNLKDILVLMMVLGAVYMGLKLQEKRNFLYALGLTTILLAFYWIRVYAVVLILVSFAAWIALAVKGPKKVIWLAIATVGGILAFPAGGYQLFQEHAKGDWIYGPIRMALTPQPWSIEPEYSFLLIPSLLHWCFFLPCLAAGASLWRKNLVFRLAAIFALVSFIFYGQIPELHGPRQRVMVAWVFAWLEFHVLWLLSSPIMERRSPAVRLSTEGRRSLVANRV
jgi:hypothetical protein